MTSFLFALQFLTLIPVRIKNINPQKVSLSLVYFPIVGLLLGLVLAGVYYLLQIFGLAPLSTDIILVVLLIILTGGLHLDGLADTADAFCSGKDKEGMLKIMRDSHAGVMGVLGLTSVILLKIAFLYSISATTKLTALLLMCLLSRWSQVSAMFFFPYARTEGKARIFMQQINFRIFIFSTFIALVCSLAVWELKGLMLMLTVGLVTYLMARFINSRIQGLTGDTLGAIGELTELFILLQICLIERIWII